jgi:hypothetical protein
VPIQRRLLRWTLALLGATALAGFSTVLVPGGEVVWRLAGTLFAATIALGVASLLARMLGRAETRRTGALALEALTVGFVLVLMLLWADLFFSWWDSTLRLTLTALLYFPCAIGAVAGFAMASRGGRFAGWSLLVSACLTLAVGSLGIWAGPLGLPHDDELGGTTGLLALSGLIGAICLAGLPASRRRWAWIGVALAAAGLAIGLYGVWEHAGGDPTLLVQAFLLASAIGAANLLLLIELPRGYRWLVHVTLALVLLTALAATLVNVSSRGFERYELNDLPGRLLSASGIAAACGMLAVGVTRAFARRVLATDARGVTDIREITLTCPRCGKAHRGPIGESRCGSCGLVLVVQIAEPRCANCDYSLLDIRAGVCPECGTPIGAAQAEPPSRSLA